MTIAGALALTGLFLIFAAAVVVGVITEDRRTRPKLEPPAWIVFILGIASFIAAAWTAALT